MLKPKDLLSNKMNNKTACWCMSIQSVNILHTSHSAKAIKNRNFFSLLYYRLNVCHTGQPYLSKITSLFFQTVSGRVTKQNSATFHSKVACFLPINHRLAIKIRVSFHRICKHI